MFKILLSTARRIPQLADVRNTQHGNIDNVQRLPACPRVFRNIAHVILQLESLEIKECFFAIAASLNCTLHKDHLK